MTPCADFAVIDSHEKYFLGATRLLGEMSRRGTEWPVTACFLFISVFLAVSSGQRAGLKPLVRREALGAFHTLHNTTPPGSRAIMCLVSSGTVCGWFTPMLLFMRRELKVISLFFTK